MLEITHGNSFQRVIPVFGLDKDGLKSPLPTEGMTVNFSVYKDGKLQYTQDLEQKDEGFYLDLSEDDINSFEEGEYTAKMKIKQGKETKTKTFPLIISE